jgi:hypothetical protein
VYKSGHGGEIMIIDTTGNNLLIYSIYKYNLKEEGNQYATARPSIFEQEMLGALDIPSWVGVGCCSKIICKNLIIIFAYGCHHQFSKSSF